MSNKQERILRMPKSVNNLKNSLDHPLKSLARAEMHMRDKMTQ